MGSEVLPPYTAKLTSFHTAQQDNNPFTVYVVTVRKNHQQWQVFRRYKEWEDLRMRLCQHCGGAPQMPGKMLFGRMRPEVIETRVLGLNHFLQMVLSSPVYATSRDLVDFLESDKNCPPPGLDLVLDPHDNTDASAPEGTAEGQRQAQLKQLVEEASQAFIPVSHDIPPLDPSYLAERAATYASTLRPSAGLHAGTSLSLSTGASSPAPSAAAAATAIARLMAVVDGPPASAEELLIARDTAAAAAAALSGVRVHGAHEVLSCVG